MNVEKKTLRLLYACALHIQHTLWQYQKNLFIFCYSNYFAFFSSLSIMFFSLVFFDLCCAAASVDCFGLQTILWYACSFDWIQMQITANLDVFIRRFNEIQFWVVTEIVSQSSINKRVSLIRKFIKLAA